ncbi:MAG: hypothetical protein ACOX6P_09695 [Candidatus Merdivicinus sp.]|jgi:hypothetical protein
MKVFRFLKFEDRVQEGFKQDLGKPLKKAEILPCCEPGRPVFAREYSYSIINYALRVFWENEQDAFTEANAALADNCRFYLAHPEGMDDRDSFYWSIDLFCRIIEFFGKEGQVNPGLVESQTEALFYEMAFDWCSRNSVLERAEYQKTGTWHVWESENHHVQGFTTAWQLSGMLARQQEYTKCLLPDGKTLTEHHHKWGQYIQRWICERGRKSLFIETANGGYAAETLKGIYNVYDFSDDRRLHELAGSLLDLYWASWAEEQINGVRGGGKSRVYPKWIPNGTDELRKWSWYYFGFGEMPENHGNIFTIMTSNYRIPQRILDYALNPEKRGCYEIYQRPLGLAADGCYINPDYHLKTDWGGIERYSYVTPDYILGTLICEDCPAQDWTLISSQNRFQGVIFASHPDARIVPVPECMASDRTPIMRSYNQFVSAQRMGCLITRKAADAVDTGKMRIWFSSAGGLDQIQEESGWLFSNTEGAFAAVRIVQGSYHIQKEENGCWIVCEEEYTPVILEVQRDVKSQEEFIREICSQPYSFDGKVLRYTSTYGNSFEFCAGEGILFKIDGESVPRRLDQAFKSPFIHEDWNEGTVSIGTDKEIMRLIFSEETTH